MGGVIPIRAITWRSSNPRIASPSPEVTYNGLKAGSATVTTEIATIDGATVKKAIKVTVVPPPPQVSLTVPHREKG